MSIAYNSSVAPTGSALIPLNYDTLEFICHFELSPTPEVGLGPPYVNSGNFEVMVNDSKKPMLWTNTSDSALTASAAAAPVQVGAPPSPQHRSLTGQNLHPRPHPQQSRLLHPVVSPAARLPV